jgi:hypothetical protein
VPDDLTRRGFLSSMAIAGAASALALPQSSPARPAAIAPISVETKRLLVSVDPVQCIWSAQVKGTAMQLDEVSFLSQEDTPGWKVTSSVNQNDDTPFGSFVTVRLQGIKPGRLDFDYQLSVSKAGVDILVSLGRTNHTGEPVDLRDMDYFVSSDARLGGTSDRWINLGTHSRNRDYYDDLWAVSPLITPKMYEVNSVTRDAETGNSLLMGHITTAKGASRFELRSGWEGTTPDRMQVRGYCSYKITMAPGKSFTGEKLIIHFSNDALRAMEHQADLIAIAHDIRLKHRRPINLDDRELVSNNYSRYHGWMSGGTTAEAEKFIAEHGLKDFYWGLGGPVSGGSLGIYGCGGSVHGRPRPLDYPSECFLAIRTPKYGGERVIDFSNPLTIKLERERAFAWAADRPDETGRAEMDFADWWDKWPGQHDPYKTALETYRAACLPWREAIDEKAPRRVVRSNMEPVDHSYGTVDICRISEDADRGYEEGVSPLAQTKSSCLFTESVLGSANRFFYNGRVFWNDGDGFHVYKYNAPDGKTFTEGQAKVAANFHALAGNTLFLSEAFNVPYPEDRIELLKRISPPTMDTAYPVDLFVRRPAQVWNMPIDRSFARWNVLAVFNYTRRPTGQLLSNSIIEMMAATNGGTFSIELDAAKDLRLDPQKEYIVYEFWKQKLIGTFKGTFISPPVPAYDCDVYSIVEKQAHPTLVSTSRHVRQMAFDIKEVGYDERAQLLRGVSRAVAGDPYELRIYVPNGFTVKQTELSDGLTASLKTEANLLTVGFTSTTGKEVAWKVLF